MGARSSDLAPRFIKPNDRLSSFERLEIYNRVYWFRVLDCLYDDYPGLRAVLGERKFMKLRYRLSGQVSVGFLYPAQSWGAARTILARGTALDRAADETGARHGAL